MPILKLPVTLLTLAAGIMAAQPVSISGPSVPELAAYDDVITGIMARYSVPAAQFAITRNGKLIFAHGYGTTDIGGQTAVQPDSLFRLASLSKQLTAVAILQLWDQGKIDLDRPAFAYMPDLQPLPGGQQDSRLSRVTIRNLLQHSGGWDEGVSPDPLDQTVEIANQFGKIPPASSSDIIRAMLGRRLNYDPGSRFAYSNFGYLVLGRVIERLTGMNYEQYVRTKILAPLGIERMRTGNTLAAGRIAGEVAYSSPGNGQTVFAFGPASLPIPYGGGFYLECMDANAGWVASAPDLLKFWNAIDGRLGGPLLSAAAIAQLTARPSLPEYSGSVYWYGMGFHISPDSWWHDGYLDGTRTLAVRSNSGFDWVALFDKVSDPDFSAELDAKLWTILSQTSNWPTNDLYPSFATPNVSRPAIQTQDGVVNGASFQRGFAAGSWVTIFGSYLSSTTRSWTGADFSGSSLPIALDGVSVTMGGKPVAIAYVSPGQINVQAPSGLVPGAVAVEVFRDGMSSGPALAQLSQFAPALFGYAAGGSVYAAAVFPDGALVGDPARVPGARLARPGDQISLYGSNFEASQAGLMFSRAQPLGSLASVKIGGVTASVQYAGLTGVGLYQVNLLVPNVPDGDQVVSLAYGGVAAPGILIGIRH